MRKTILMLIAMLALCACRMNNGDIGDFFGSWLLYSMTVDGHEADGFDPEMTFWEFQNNIIEISQIDKYHEKSSRWGTWADTDGRLLLDFTHSEAGIAPGTDKYRAPEWLYFPENKVIDLELIERQPKRMILKWHDAEHNEIVYSLRKIW